MTGGGDLQFADIDNDHEDDACSVIGSYVRCYTHESAYSGVDDPDCGFSSTRYERTFPFNIEDNAKYGNTLSFIDLDGDDDADLCSRGPDGIWCAKSNGLNFDVPQRWTASYADAWGWGQARYDDTMKFVDVDQDGRTDVCARGSAGIWCSFSDGTASKRPLCGRRAETSATRDRASLDRVPIRPHGEARRATGRRSISPTSTTMAISTSAAAANTESSAHASTPRPRPFRPANTGFTTSTATTRAGAGTPTIPPSSSVTSRGTARRMSAAGAAPGSTAATQRASTPSSRTRPPSTRRTSFSDTNVGIESRYATLVRTDTTGDDVLDICVRAYGGIYRAASRGLQSGGNQARTPAPVLRAVPTWPEGQGLSPAFDLVIIPSKMEPADPTGLA